MTIGRGLLIAAGDGVAAGGNLDGEAAEAAFAVRQRGACLVRDAVVRVGEEGQCGSVGRSAFACEDERRAAFFYDGFLRR